MIPINMRVVSLERVRLCQSLCYLSHPALTPHRFSCQSMSILSALEEYPTMLSFKHRSACVAYPSRSIEPLTALKESTYRILVFVCFFNSKSRSSLGRDNMKQCRRLTFKSHFEKVHKQKTRFSSPITNRYRSSISSVHSRTFTVLFVSKTLCNEKLHCRQSDSNGKCGVRVLTFSYGVLPSSGRKILVSSGKNVARPLIPLAARKAWITCDATSE